MLKNCSHRQSNSTLDISSSKCAAGVLREVDSIFSSLQSKVEGQGDIEELLHFKY